ncbi:MAG TPA: DUF445 family protein [Firmicutes bacterium]|nr:DUF445 family protein [Bacillota bacterium]
MHKKEDRISDENRDGIREEAGADGAEGAEGDFRSILTDFLGKWGKWVARELKSAFSAAFRRPLPILPGWKRDFTGGDGETPHPALSLKITAALNLLNLPLFYGGIFILIWLISEPVFEAVLAPGVFARIRSYSQPFVAVLGPAVVGYFTNWLAIKMLFHPRQPNAVWWGLIPARREDIIETISTEILNRLISPEIISDYLHQEGIVTETLGSTLNVLAELVDQPDFRLDYREVLAGFLSDLLSSAATRHRIREYLEERIIRWQGETFSGKMIEWSKKIWGPKVIGEIDRILASSPQEVAAFLPDLEKIFIDFTYTLREKAGDGQRRVEETLITWLPKVLSKLEFKEIIHRQLRKLDEAELEAALVGNVQRELVFIQTSGGIFGLLVGLAILYPYLRLVFAGAAFGLWGVYRLTRS